MPASTGDVEHVALLGGDGDGSVLAVGRTFGAQVDDDVEGGTTDSADQLGLRCHALLVVDAAEGAASGAEAVVHLVDARI